MFHMCQFRQAAVGCRLGLPRSAPYFAVQPQKGRSRRVVLQSTICGADVPTRRRRRQGSSVRNILLSNSDGPRATHWHENGWPPVYIIQFSKICEPLPPTPYDENGRFRYYTSNSIHEAKSAPEVVVETRPSRVATIIQRAS